MARKHPLTTEENKKVKLLYVNRFSAKDVAEHFDVSPQAIHTKYRIFKAEGVVQVDQQTVASFLETTEDN